MSATIRNVALAALLAAIAAFSMVLHPPESYLGFEVLAYLVPTAGLVLLTLFRRKPLIAEDAWWMFAVCAWSLAYPFTFRGVPGNAFGEIDWIIPARLVLLFAADLSLFVLGRSFGILPAVRAVRTGGPYAVVRHPVYALYVLGDACLLFFLYSPWNVAVAASGAATFAIRAYREERLLMRIPAYRGYAARVRWRFLPLVH